MGVYAGSAPRLSLHVIIQEVPGACNLLAPVCSSYVVTSRGTSRRSVINPDGFVLYDFVSLGNLLVSRPLAYLRNFY